MSTIAPTTDTDGTDGTDGTDHLVKTSGGAAVSRLSAPAAHPPTVSLGGVLRSEWVKLRSLRSTLTTLGAAGLIMLVVGLTFAAVTAGLISGGDGNGPSEFANNPAGATLQGTLFAQLVIGVLGVMLITSEYATGTIRNTLAVVPKRLPVLHLCLAAVALNYPSAPPADSLLRAADPRIRASC